MERVMAALIFSTNLAWNLESGTWPGTLNLILRDYRLPTKDYRLPTTDY